MNCKECKEKRNNMKEIPFIAVEADKVRAERREKRHFIIELVLIVLLVVTNAAWLWYESQFEAVTETTETYTIEAQQDGTGTNIVGGGDIEYGAESKNNEN